MHAYLIIAFDREQRDQKTAELVEKLQAKKIEFPVTKIADVRELKQFTKLKVTQKTAIVIHDFDEVSNEAQNAFLKSLEEPQDNLYYILTTKNSDDILPTIVSRCEVVEIQNAKGKIKDEDQIKIKEFVAATSGERLRIVSKINKRDDAISFMTDLIACGHNLFLENPQLSTFIENANRTLQNLEANGNVTLQLTNFIVGL